MEDNMEKAELKLKPLRKNNINKFVTIILLNILGYLSLCWWKTHFNRNDKNIFLKDCQFYLPIQHFYLVQSKIWNYAKAVTFNYLIHFVFIVIFSVEAEKDWMLQTKSTWKRDKTKTTKKKTNRIL